MSWFTIQTVLTRFQRRHLCDIVTSMAVSAGALWYATILPPGTLSVLFSIIGWCFVVIACLESLCAALDLATCAAHRRRTSR